LPPQIYGFFSIGRSKKSRYLYPPSEIYRMTTIAILPEIRAKCPGLTVGSLWLEARGDSAGPALKPIIAATAADLAQRMTLEDIHGLTAIRATRAAYRACGKEPSRYRPSAEALLRRVVTGKGLYEINALVDLLNWISISSGYSIGGFDLDKVQGPVSLGIGKAGEPFQAIGRGALNIECLPVLRDAAGAFGTPTSDSERTAVTTQTKNFWMVFYDFAGDPSLPDLLANVHRQYALYCEASSGSWRVFS
jgi:DNA/RNA-binding domain of Phe-tRNA-synthetase-like protein